MMNRDRDKSIKRYHLSVESDVNVAYLNELYYYIQLPIAMPLERPRLVGYWNGLLILTVVLAVAVDLPIFFLASPSSSLA